MTWTFTVYTDDGSHEIGEPFEGTEAEAQEWADLLADEYETQTGWHVYRVSYERVMKGEGK